MKTIAIHLQKGGVGKTTMAGALAYELSKRGRTILVDCDPQGNASSWHLKDAPDRELADVLAGKATAREAIAATTAPGLDILATFGLDGGLKLYGETTLSNEPFILCELMDELAGQGYEYAILDLSPGMGRLEKAALIAAAEVVTPMTPEYFALDGLAIFDAELTKTTKAMRRGPEHRIIIVNAFDKRIEQHRAVADEAAFMQGRAVFRVPVDPCFRKAQALHLPAQELPKESAPKAETTAALESITEALWH